MMTKEGSTKIINFINHGAGVLMLLHDYISHYSEYAFSSTILKYRALFALFSIVLRDNNADFLICKFIL